MSELVQELLNQIYVHKLPEAITEYRFYKPRRWRFDLCYPELKLAIEVEGGTWSGGRHTRGQGFEDDCEKYSIAAIEGWSIIRVTGRMIRDGVAIDLLHLAFTPLHERTKDNILVKRFSKKERGSNVRKRRQPRLRVQRNVRKA